MYALKLGDFSLDVVRLQLHLDLFPTGYFDDRTLKAVLKFQKAHKLKADGEVGPKTRAALDLGPVSVATSAPLRPLTSWMNIALTEKNKKIRENDKPGKHHPRILEYFRSTTHASKDDETAWCSAYMNFVMEASGRPGTGGADAKSWLTWKGGTIVKAPKYGDIAVTKRKKHSPQVSGFHVAFFISASKTHITLLGGNQENMVKETEYSLEQYESVVYIRPKSDSTSIFLKFGNILGSATLKGYEGQMPIATLSFGAERAVSMEAGNLANRESGRPVLSRIALTRVADQSIASLFAACVQCTAAQEATIAFVRTGTSVQEYLTYKLRDCLVSGHAIDAGAEDAPAEALMLSFSALEVTYQDRDASGKAASPMRAGYSVKEARMA